MEDHIPRALYELLSWMKADTMVYIVGGFAELYVPNHHHRHATLFSLVFSAIYLHKISRSVLQLIHPFYHCSYSKPSTSPSPIMHFHLSSAVLRLVAATTLGSLAQAAPRGEAQIINARQGQSGEEVVFGPGQICIGVAPGAGSTCFDIPAGCSVIRPKDNTVPTPTCQPENPTIQVGTSTPESPTGTSEPAPVVEDLLNPLVRFYLPGY